MKMAAFVVKRRQNGKNVVKMCLLSNLLANKKKQTTTILSTSYLNFMLNSKLRYLWTKHLQNIDFVEDIV